MWERALCSSTDHLLTDRTLFHSTLTIGALFLHFMIHTTDEQDIVPGAQERAWARGWNARKLPGRPSLGRSGKGHVQLELYVHVIQASALDDRLHGAIHYVRQAACLKTEALLDSLV